VVQTELHRDPESEDLASTGGYNVWIWTGRDLADYLLDRLAGTQSVISRPLLPLSAGCKSRSSALEHLSPKLGCKLFELGHEFSFAGCSTSALAKSALNRDFPLQPAVIPWRRLPHES
jgi:hypothetical protein